MKSFISGVATAEDGHGHGTHCAGTACGPATTQTPPRYGVAPSADLFIGKVLNDQGFGVDGDILAGIDWALEQGCNVISMSLAAAVAPGATYSAAYEQAAVAAREQGCLIVSAAGNDSRRPGLIAPVGHPANCPTILAIAAIDDQMQVAPFSNGHVGSGKTPWLAGPGVQVYSSWISPRLYNTIGGTSMATPHAAGIVALFAESTGLRGTALENAVLSGCLKLGLPASDIGGGLPQAP
jgi:subtilisin family serine protease